MPCSGVECLACRDELEVLPVLVTVVAAHNHGYVLVVSAILDGGAQMIVSSGSCCLSV